MANNEPTDPTKPSREILARMGVDKMADSQVGSPNHTEGVADLEHARFMQAEAVVASNLELGTSNRELVNTTKRLVHATAFMAFATFGLAVVALIQLLTT